ncbi:putative cAMP phosphodiesterase A [Trypanosoma rangeli]|uniref:Putative cAMP phosphodiesterase A n=1 Tax=Trypanosoma rangeli TaxID=5698 RepID=A0A3R7KYN7_TRYRA|nr:putative cAMP phosphodiesterase A [Trypanosoma rangeli]RNF03996.1 putative cAMP phosphodiesterase A [Trypanosoma rangeli]|eukprot:RNF03996.1 putative cAMP phosphodiesterase A [Trypanosoma rangeli]
MSEIPGLPVQKGRSDGRSDSCATCGNKFSPPTAKSNCPCCEKLCCSDCVQAECAIVAGSASSKVCIDCFSMLQSNRHTGPVESSPSPEFYAASVSPPRSLTPANGRERSAAAHARASGDERTQDALAVDGECASLSVFQQYVGDPKHSEFLQTKSDSLLRHLRERELELQSLRVERDRAIAPIAPGEKCIWNKTEVQQTSEENAKELREQLDSAQLRMGAMETELKKALDRAKSSEATVQLLQQRIGRYEDEVARLQQSQKGLETAPGSVHKDTLWTRKLHPSIVQDTVLTVVTPKSCEASGLDVNLRDWKFDSFEVASRVPSVLQSVAMNVALAWNLFSSHDEFQRWVMLVAAVENNYRPNAYHNAIHAADALQGVFYLVTSATPLMEHMTPLELKAAAFAALVHDVRHPGRTSGFLAAVQDPVSYKYSGSGSLEQLHVATAFELLTVPEFDFTSSMDNASFLEFKNIVTHLILHTELRLHHDIISKLGAKVGAGRLDCTRKEDRLDALSFILHAADIGAPSRGVAIARRWLVVLQEFADQAEDERRRGLPVTPGFDTPSLVESSQIAFLDFFVIPTFDLLHQLFSSIEEPLHNLRKLREVYAAKAGVKTPFPPPVDYRGQEEKSQRLEAGLAEHRSQGREFYRLLEELKTAGINLKRKSAALRTKEEELIKRSCLQGQGEGRWKFDPAKTGDELQTEKEMRGPQQVYIDPLRNETVEATAGRDGTRDQVGGWSETIEARERKLREREAALMMSARSMDIREKKLAAFSEKLADIAERLHAEQKRVRETENPAVALPHRESLLVATGDADINMARPSLAQHEAEERLAKKYNEVDELLLMVRAMRIECVAISGTDVRQRALSATLAEREAAIAEAVELSRQRRRQAEEGRGLRPTSMQLSRLESAIFQLTAAITLLAE